MKRPYLYALVAALLSMTTTMAWGQKKYSKSDLEGIWQMCFYVSEAEGAPTTLRAGNTFKILSSEGDITNFTVIPGRGAIITGVGTYKLAGKDGKNVLRESMKKNIHLPMLDGHENDLEFSLTPDGNVMSVKFYIEKDAQGNVIDATYYETWRRVSMPAEYPRGLIR